jgi:hypothetical protein
MAIVPGIYVTLEDRSYMIEQPPSGRSGLVVVLGDRGEHNRVVEYNSLNEFIAFCGKPEIEKTGQGHYMAASFLSQSNRLFVIRAALLDSDNPSYNAATSNSIIRYNPVNGSDLRISGDFAFINETDAASEFGDSFISKYVFTNYVGYNNVSVGDIIYSDSDSNPYGQEVISKGMLEGVGSNESEYVYWLELDSNYTGTSTVDTSTGINYLITYAGTDPLDFSFYSADPHSEFSENAIKFYPGTKLNTIGTFTFKNESNIVVAPDQASFDSVKQEQWIYPVSGNVEYLRQVSYKTIDNITGEFQLILNEPYPGPDSATPEEVLEYTQFAVTSQKFVKSENDFDVNSNEHLWYMYARGVGSYYNNIFIKGNRNYQLERMYIDDDGNPLYKYAFIDISIYGENEDGSTTLLEGPWTCSIINKIGNRIVRDLNTGRELYITKTINERSKYIKCIDGINAPMLEGYGEDKDHLRLNVISLFADSYVNKTETRGLNGFYFENGSDGIQYDNWGRINSYHPEITQLVRSVYNGSIKSVDGSIELLKHTVYPWYQIDYVISGGYSSDIQNAARELVDSREDCLLLADTGQYSYDADEDIERRKSYVPWNTFNAALYTQYREITDPFSSKPLYISPVYHAITSHLDTDRRYFISEPVAGIEKGAIEEHAKLAYKPSMIDMENMIDVELNPVISEIDGTYIITQFTTYKRLSILKRIHAVKFAHFLRKQLPTQLKGLIQRRATPYWISVAKSIIDTFMRPYIDKNSTKYSVTYYDSEVVFDEERSELYVSLSVKFVRAIETIQINIVTL